ncbi:MAG: Penicillin-binding protein, 1A family [Candidatus Magasanikbacteria bacterium GW2011_GWA2_56_11]|uniref:Penicillin-binding protein, 1A family n=1 Tax=Candidatus Magasanikbacteria bacterium GW2011_GWA2_56_11 TaxID=1619044 RepID=A0A0G1YFG0_9BACT|nr:MAG: Penicillin-binding protein, 1A family [Candidatus Magasanikbacteria bacterium GW2011_GWA2_56_11]
MPIPRLIRRSYGYEAGGPTSRPPRRGHQTPNGGPETTRPGRWRKRGGLALGAALATAFGLVVWSNQYLPDPNKLNDRHFAQSTKIYDRTGTHLLHEIFADEKRTIVELQEIPRYLIDGVIATEDKKFYEHHGIRPLSIARALAYGLFTNKKISGTSTLTQQLVKNAILTNERTISRKIKEAILALRLEQKYSKDEILKIYFNEIPYGSTNYGVEAAAQSYFGKHVSDLTLAEAAALAGLPQKPSVYLNDLEALEHRRNFVLQRMADESYVSQEEADKAKAEPLNLKRNTRATQAPHFVFYTEERLVEKYGESMVEKGGLRVITTLDWDKQQIAEKAIQEFGGKLLEQGGADNAALVALDPKTGQILAMVGSRDYYDDAIDGQFNVVTHARRQPGSSIKPIIYAAAFEKGFTPNTVLYDVVTTFPGGDKAYIPKNYDLSEHGPVTMRKALQGSLNIPAVKTLYLVGLPRAITFAERLGYTTFKKDAIGLSLVLGGGEVKMLEHVNAYATLANNGTRHSPAGILKIEDPKGEILYEWKEEKGEAAIDPQLAATISGILSDDAARAFVFGAGSALTLPDRSVAAKSGTTNNYVDAWVVGYTPSLTAGVWGGNTDNRPMKQGFGGSKIAGQIWNYFMREALKNTPAEKFPAPPPVTAAKPMLNGLPSGGIKLLVDEVTGKIATSSTPEKYIIEKIYLPPHDILHYVDKDEPLGPIPSDPAKDPEYLAWEKAVQEWIARQREKNPDWDASFEEPPTEYDDIHSLELIPTLEVVYPAANQVISSREINTDIRVSAERGVSKVSYKIDGVYAGVINSHPFNLNYYAQTLEPGEHTLTVIVEDDVGNRVSENVPFTLTAPAEPPGAHFNDPPSTLGASSLPFTFFLKVYRPEAIAEIKISALHPDSGTSLTLSTITDLSQLTDNQLGAGWKAAPHTGGWKIMALVKLKDGTERVSDTANIEIK